MVQRTQDTPASLSHSPEHRHTSRLPQRTPQSGPTEAKLILLLYSNYCLLPHTTFRPFCISPEKPSKMHWCLQEHDSHLFTHPLTLVSAEVHTQAHTHSPAYTYPLTQEAYVLFDLDSLITLPGLSLSVISLTSPPLCASGTRWLLQDPMDLTPASTAPSHHDWEPRTLQCSGRRRLHDPQC